MKSRKMRSRRNKREEGKVDRWITSSNRRRKRSRRCTFSESSNSASILLISWLASSCDDNEAT